MQLPEANELRQGIHRNDPARVDALLAANPSCSSIEVLTRGFAPR
jgi:hypothetical protein